MLLLLLMLGVAQPCKLFRQLDQGRWQAPGEKQLFVWSRQMQELCDVQGRISVSGTRVVWRAGGLCCDWGV